VQDARRGERDLRDMQGRMRLLLAGIQARGPPADTDTSIAAHLLRLRDPSTGVVVG
jgi:fatty acid synthase